MSRNRTPRRKFLSLAGVSGLAATTGCLRLTSESRDQNQQDPDAETEEDDDSPPSSPTETSTTPQNAAGRADPELSQRWSGWSGAYYIWKVAEEFYCSAPGGTARVQQSHIVWDENKTIENGEYHLPDDAFGYSDDTVITGFFADVGREEPYSVAGAHFYAYDRESGNQRWTLATPADGAHRQAVDATITEGIAALGCTDWTESTDIVYGVDAELSDVVWERSYDRQRLNAVVSYAEKFFLCFESGLTVLDPNTGTEIETRDGIRTDDAIVSGNSLFTIDENVVVSYRLDDDEVQWRGPTVQGISTSITVDPSVVVVGAEDGGIHMLDRLSGERVWQGSITGEVHRIAVTPFNVWARNTESGLFALNRDDGTIVHQSTHASGSGLAVMNDILLMEEGEKTTAYWIE